jgi:hypothetical protein
MYKAERDSRHNVNRTKVDIGIPFSQIDKSAIGKMISHPV